MSCFHPVIVGLHFVYCFLSCGSAASQPENWVRYEDSSKVVSPLQKASQVLGAEQKQQDDSIVAAIIKVQVQAFLDTLDSAYFMPDKDVGYFLHNELEAFYRERDYQLAWFTLKAPRPQAEALFNAIARAGEEGLHPGQYLLAELRQQVKRFYAGSYPRDSYEDLIKLDFLTTSAALTFASHLLSGSINPTEINNRWMSSPRQLNLSQWMNHSIERNSLKADLLNLAPKHEQYKKLKTALASYKKIEREGGWPVIPADSTFRYGDTSAVVGLLRRRLATTGDLQAEEVDHAWKQVFDVNLEMAVESYQQRNGLTVDGIVGPSTLAALNVPVQQRIKQLEVNLERYRWLPDDFGSKYIKINVPEFKLRVYEDGREVLAMKVVVGKEYHSTPIFNDTLHYIEFSPTWTLPLSIARRDILPKLKQDPAYLSKNHFLLYQGWSGDSEPVDPYTIDWAQVSAEDFTYKVVQQPGPFNSLGLVKFMFPNKMSIYMHDTPAQYLFERSSRGYSSGCIRLEKPVELAEYLLKDRNISREDILSYMKLDEPYALSVADQQVHIEILYSTAWVDKEGKVNFREDIYGYDKAQISALYEKVKRLNK